MNKEHEKVPRWAWKIAWLLLIVGILVVTSTAIYKSLPSWGTSWFAKANYENCHFAAGQIQMTLSAESDEWSCWIVTPPGTDYRIDADGKAKIRFIDGSKADVGPDVEASWVGVKRGIFQVLSLEESSVKVTVTISR